jgi:hypothetical protein
MIGRTIANIINTTTTTTTTNNNNNNNNNNSKGPVTPVPTHYGIMPSALLSGDEPQISCSGHFTPGREGPSSY